MDEGRSTWAPSCGATAPVPLSLCPLTSLAGVLCQLTPPGMEAGGPQSASRGLQVLCYSSGSRRSRTSGFGRESVTDPSILHSSLPLA